jgi:hypothetical protein
MFRVKFEKTIQQETGHTHLLSCEMAVGIPR